MGGTSCVYIGLTHPVASVDSACVWFVVRILSSAPLKCERELMFAAPLSPFRTQTLGEVRGEMRK